jgi:sugar lactone lactonase YvrE
MTFAKRPAWRPRGPVHGPRAGIAAPRPFLDWGVFMKPWAAVRRSIALVPIFLAFGATSTFADLLVSDLDTSSVFLVSSTTGNRSTFSGAGVGMGVAFSNPEGIAVQASGQVLVADNGVAALFQVNPTTGNRTLLSGDGAGTGQQSFVTPFGVTIGSGGQLYVSDAGDQAGDGFIVRVDPVTGARTLISGLGAGSGDAFSNIRGVVFVGGELYVTDVANQAVYRVDPITGARTIISDATHGMGTFFGAPEGLTVDTKGNLLIADAGNQTVVRVDPVTGNRTIVSGLGMMGTGTGFALPSGVTVDSLGKIQVADSGDLGIPALPAVFNVDPTTGNRTILSDFAHGSGPRFQNLDIGISQLTPVAAVPEPSTSLLIGVALACALGGLSLRGVRGRSKLGTDEPVSLRERLRLTIVREADE